MDWLSKNRVMLDCHRKTIVFGGLVCSSPVSREFLTASQVEASLKDGALGCLMFWCMNGEKELRVEELPVVCDFLDVFPSDVPGLPPPREIEFSIELVPGTGPISVAPYRMSPLELSELKQQLEELLEKGFVLPSVSP